MSEILLSFDIEEFDLPLEYGELINEHTQLEISRKGLENILSLLDKLDISATFFITANFALHYPELIIRIAYRHEVASHTYYHSVFNHDHLGKSKSVLEELTNEKIYGIRLPRLKHIDSKEIQEAGYIYNASLNPTFIPGRYNNFLKKRLPFLEKVFLLCRSP